MDHPVESTTNRNKIYAFLTARKKIYAKWEQNLWFFDRQEENICPMGIKSMIFSIRRKDILNVKKPNFS